MLQRADAEKTQYSLVGKVGQGIYPQGSDKTYRPDDDRMTLVLLNLQPSKKVAIERTGAE